MPRVPRYAKSLGVLNFQPYSTSPERGAWTAAVEALIIAGSKPNKIP